MRNRLIDIHLAQKVFLTTATSMLAIASFSAKASAQAATPDTLVSVCSGVSLPPSVVTTIIDPVVTGIYGPIEAHTNQTLSFLDTLLGPLGFPPPLSINVSGLLTTAASGSDIGLNVLALDGTLVGPSDECNATADSFTLDTPAGIAIGGNAITGLGDNGEQARAGEIDSIAIGNRAVTDAAALGSIALGTDSSIGAGGTASVAVGTGSSVSVANSVALGAGSIAGRGPQSGYSAFASAGPQDSAGEISVGAPGAERQITNVAAGSAPTDAVNVSQLAAVAAAIPANAVEYDDSGQSIITLQGSAGTTITNVAAGAINAGSTDAVNGSQLFATNQQVQNNTTAITNLSISIANGALGPVQYSNPATPDVPNGGVQTNDLTLVGASPGPVALHNVADGVIAVGSTDAVNGGQIAALALSVANAVVYETDAAGNRTNNVLLVGGDPAALVTISGLAPGAVTAASTQAVNGSQLFATNQAVVTAQGTADAALTLGQNSVQYDSAGRNSVTFNPGGTATRLQNVAAGTASTDAVNVGQLGAAAANAVNVANQYTDARIASLNFDLDNIRREGRAGTAAALAAAALPQASDPGKSVVAAGVGTYRGRSSIAIGGSYRLKNGRSVIRGGLTYDSSQHVGANAGVGYQF
jgi:autotransporter adhesin